MSSNKKTNRVSPGQKSSTKKTTKAASPKKQKSSVNRLSQRTQRVHTDVFKTTIASLQRYMGWQKDPVKEEYTGIEHVHVFRTFNADGEAQNRTSPVSQHFHEVFIVMKTDSNGQETGEPELDSRGRPQIKIGPPMQMMRIGKGRAARTMPSRIPLYKEVVRVDGVAEEKQVYDEHTHEGLYVRSDFIEIRDVNPVAQSMIDKLNSAVAPPPTPEGTGDTSILRPNAPV